MKHINDFDDFLKENVDLNNSRLETLKNRVKSVTDYLKDNYTGYRKYSEQGSFAHKTIIKPVQDNDEFDADVIVMIRDDGFSPNEFERDYIKETHSTLRNNGNYTDKLKLNSRCVTIDYAGDFHLDIVPCIELKDDFYICNRKEQTYEQTDGDGYKNWLIEKNDVIGGNNFRKVTRLLKFLRDHKDNFSVKSILLTTMLGNCINKIDKSKCKDVPSTLFYITEELNNFLQNNTAMPTIINPVLSSEDFNRNWDEKKYSNFREKFNLYWGKIEDAYNEKDHDASVKKWRKLFGDSFGSLTNFTTSTSIKSGVAGSAVVTSKVFATKPYATYK